MMSRPHFRNGAEQVVAVEIDPLIYKLGKELHFEKPYQSPRVRFILDDARSYIERSHDRFDLIVFSLLDSHTTSSHFSNIRIDNYVYTIEALRAAKGIVESRRHLHRQVPGRYALDFRAARRFARASI